MSDAAPDQLLTVAEAPRPGPVPGELMLVADALATLPARVSERRFREAARDIGRHTLDGRQMMVTKDDVQAILKAMTKCSGSGRPARKKSGKSKGLLRDNASAEALALLTRRSPKKSAQS